MADTIPLAHAHAHNDYLNNRPLTAALDHGFTSVEADVSLHNGQLMLCHEYRGDTCYDDEGRRRIPAPFETTYLDGFSQWIAAQGGAVYPGRHLPVLLLVEIKCNEVVTSGGKVCSGLDTSGDDNNPVRVLDDLMVTLWRHRNILYTRDSAGTPTDGPVQVIVTGGHNQESAITPTGERTTVRQALEAQSPHLAFLDGTLRTDADADDAGLVPLISFQYPATTNLPAWLGQSCGFDPSKALTNPNGSGKNKGLFDQIRAARRSGHLVRVWGLPDCPTRHDPGDNFLYRSAREWAWSDAQRAGISYFSSNHLQFLRDWLLAHYN
jgi:hypothetical protein